MGGTGPPILAVSRTRRGPLFFDFKQTILITALHLEIPS